MSKFLANENISRASVELLRENGLDVSWVSDSIPSVNDEAVLDAARKENRIVITYDSDYGEMIYGRKLARPLGSSICDCVQTTKPNPLRSFLNI